MMQEKKEARTLKVNAMVNVDMGSTATKTRYS